MKILRSNTVLLLSTSLLSLPFLEAGLRFVEKVKGIKVELRVFQDSAPGPCELIPNVHTAINVGGERVVISTNSTGMHWREVAVPKPKNGRRIAFAGDSFTFGEWANRVENSFVGIVDSQMSPKGLEILNFGVPGDGLPEMEIRLQKNILVYQPDYIVVMFYNGNDISETYLGAGKTDCTSGRLRPEIVENKIPPEFRESFGQEARTFLNRYSALVRALRFVKGRLFADPRFLDLNDSTITLSAFRVDNSFLTASFWSRTAYPPIAEEARDQALRVLERIRHLALRNGAKLIVIAIPFREQVYALHETGDDYDVGLPQRYIEQFAKDANVPYYDLLRPLRRYIVACEEMIYVPSDPHFNTRGHRIVGELISRFLAHTLASSSEEEEDLRCSNGRLMSNLSGGQ